MNRLWAVCAVTLREHLRNRVYHSILVFGLILLAGGLVVSSLAMAERQRMMFDLGVAGIEFLSLIGIVFLTVNLVIQEIDSRTLYLILSHPIRRGEYLGGRFLGTWIAIGIGMVAMGLLHAGLLAMLNASVDMAYVVTWIGILGKVTLMGALALLLSLFATSTATAMTLTVFLWIMGHFTQEMAFLGERSTNPLVKGLVWLFSNFTPNLNLFAFGDALTADPGAPAAWFLTAILYTLVYSGVCFLLAHTLFAKKEM